MEKSSVIMALAILASSFWGSWHCAGMCGPIASLMAHRKSLRSYHVGKGLAYTLIGALGGLAGSFLLDSEIYYIRIVSGGIFASVLLLWGIQALRGKKWGPQFNLPVKYFKSSSGLLMGAGSIFLPCGWLYTYVFAAGATKSWQAGMLVMFLFWLGSIPALSALPLYIGKSLQMADAKKRKMGGFILIFASFYSIVSFYAF